MKLIIFSFQKKKDFIKRCLQFNKDLRPDVLTICEDPYLKPKPKSTGSASSTS